MKFNSQSKIVLLIVFIIYLLFIVYFFVTSYEQNDNRFIYILDDPYIHLAIAKNFSANGNWGIDEFSFTASSSSLLWTLSLAGLFYAFGINDYFPFILNILVSIALIFYITNILRNHINPIVLLFVLIIIIFSTSMPLLVFSGQEHLLHSLITLAFAIQSSNFLSQDFNNNGNLRKFQINNQVLIFLLGFSVTFIRFEGMFILVFVSFLAFLRRKFLFSLFLLIIGFLPIIVFGFISLSKGGFFLPNSVILKGGVPDFSSLKGFVKFFGGMAFYQMLKVPELLILFVLSTIILVKNVFSYKNKLCLNFNIFLLLIFLATLLLHLQFAKAGFFYRYEAYLIVLGIPVILISGKELLVEFFSKIFNKQYIYRTIFGSLLLVTFFLPFIYRAYSSNVSILPAAKNIYEQQYQMAKFVKKYYQGKVIALNDIGLVNYLANIKCVDLWGLANNEVAKAILEKRYSTKQIFDIARRNRVSIAILYESWFKSFGGLPNEWKLVGKWKIKNNIVCGDDIVSFFAVDSLETDKLQSYLNEFQRELPPDVTYFKLRK